MPQKDSSHIATDIVLYDLLSNPSGPSHSELWAAFVQSSPRIAKKILDYANEHSKGDMKVHDAIVCTAAKMAALYTKESPHNPSVRSDTIKQLGKQLYVGQGEGETGVTNHTANVRDASL